MTTTANPGTTERQAWKRFAAILDGTSLKTKILLAIVAELDDADSVRQAAERAALKAAAEHPEWSQEHRNFLVSAFISIGAELAAETLQETSGV